MEYSEYLDIEDELKELDNFEEILKLEEPNREKPKTAPKKLSYRQNEILKTYPDKIEELEERIKELNVALSDPEIYQSTGLQVLFEELEEKRGELHLLEDEYFVVLEFAQDIDNQI